MVATERAASLLQSVRAGGHVQVGPRDSSGTSRFGITLALLPLFLAVISSGCAGRTGLSAVPPGSELAAAFEDFAARVDAYMELREDAIEDVADARVTADPAVIRERENAIADRIRTARIGARQGDIFTPEIRAAFRRVLARQTARYGDELISTLEEDAPKPGAVPLEINGKYPAGVPFPTTPAPFLEHLPRLPRGLEYRIVDGDLILLDQPADVIIDYIRNAIPPSA
jgi:hypothetical protein